VAQKKFDQHPERELRMILISGIGVLDALRHRLETRDPT
jgi:hypothetical protein